MAITLWASDHDLQKMIGDLEDEEGDDVAGDACCDAISGEILSEELERAARRAQMDIYKKHGR